MMHVFQKQPACAFIYVCALIRINMVCSPNLCGTEEMCVTMYVLIRMNLVCSANLCGTEEVCVSHSVVVNPELEHTVNIR